MDRDRKGFQNDLHGAGNTDARYPGPTPGGNGTPAPLQRYRVLGVGPADRFGTRQDRGLYVDAASPELVHICNRSVMADGEMGTKITNEEINQSHPRPRSKAAACLPMLQNC